MVPEFVIDAIERLERVQSDVETVTDFLRSDAHRVRAMQAMAVFQPMLDAASDDLLRMSHARMEDDGTV